MLSGTSKTVLLVHLIHHGKQEGNEKKEMQNVRQYEETLLTPHVIIVHSLEKS